MRTTCAWLAVAAALLATSCRSSDNGAEDSRQGRRPSGPATFAATTVTRSQVEQLCALVDFHRRQTGERPESLDQIAPDVFQADPWGHLFGYALTETKRGYVVWSAGPDGTSGTDDDIRSDDP